MSLYGKQDLLGRVLLNHGLVTEQQLSAALESQKTSAKRLGTILVDKGWLTERELSYGISKQLMIPFVSAMEVEPEREALDLIPYSVALRLEVLPYKVEDNNIQVIISEPLNLLALDEIRMYTGLNVKTLVSTVSEIRLAIAGVYRQNEVKKDYFDTEKSFRLGEILITSGLISERQLKIALDNQSKTHEKLGQTVLNLGFINELQLTDALSKQLQIPMILLSSHSPSEAALSLVPRSFAEKHQILPVSFLPDGELRIAITELLSKESVQELRDIAGSDIEFVLALPSAMRREIPRFYRVLELEEIEETRKGTRGALLGDILMNGGAITRQQLHNALDEQKLTNMRIGEILIKNGHVSEKQLAVAISTQLDIPMVSFQETNPTREALSLVPIDIARRLEIIPLEVEGDILKIAIAEPLNLLAIDELRDFTGKNISPMVSTPSQIRFNLDNFYRENG